MGPEREYQRRAEKQRESTELRRVRESMDWSPYGPQRPMSYYNPADFQKSEGWPAQVSEAPKTLQALSEAMEGSPPVQAYRQARIGGEQAMAEGNPYLSGFGKGYAKGWNAPVHGQTVTAEQTPGGWAVDLLEPVQTVVGVLTGGLGKTGQMTIPGARALAGAAGRTVAKPFQQYARRQAMKEGAPQLLRAMEGEVVGGAGRGMADVGTTVSTQRPRWLPKRDVYEVLPYDPERGYYPILSETEDDLKRLYYNLHGHEADTQRLRGFATPQYETPAPGVQQWKHDVAAVHNIALPQGSMTHEVAGHLPEFRYRGLASDAMRQQARRQVGPEMGADISKLPEVFEQAGASLPEAYQGMNPYEQGMEYLARYRAGQLPGIGKIPFIENSSWYKPFYQYGEGLMNPMKQAIANRIQDHYTKEMARKTAERVGAVHISDPWSIPEDAANPFM